MSNEKIQTIIKVAKRIAPKFAFDIYDADDMINEAIILGMDCIERYDEGRGPFEHFVATHINNRLRTFVRKHSPRPEPDAPKSSLDYIHWNRSFGSKKRLQEASSIDDVGNLVAHSTDIVDQMSIEDIQMIIDTKLPVEYRADYLRLLNDVHVSKIRRNKIKEIILEILAESGYEAW